MYLNLETFRNRIGIYSRLYFKPVKPRKQSYKPSTRSLLRIRTLKFIFLISWILLHRESFLHDEDQQYQQYQFGSLASASKPVHFFILGGQVSTCLSQDLLFSMYDVLAVHSAATVAGVQGVHLDRGIMVIAVPLQFSILADSNFYARYTYGNRSSKGIKLCHWNAGSAHLENKISDIENLILDCNPHLLGISEANLYKSHCMDSCRITDLIPCSTLNNKALQVSRVVV